MSAVSVLKRPPAEDDPDILCYRFEPDLKTDLNKWIHRKTNGVVQSGPFAGMKLSQNEVWKDGNLGTKLLGCYEKELHGFIEDEIKRLSNRPSRIVDIGCAEGFYSVGLALRLLAVTLKYICWT